MGQGIEGQDDSEFIVGGIRHTESGEQEGGGDHMADAAHFELCPIRPPDSMLELFQDIAAEIREEKWYGFGCHLRPEFMGHTKQRHECTSWAIHVQDASG